MSALSDDQQRSLDEKKGQIRLDNEKYLRDHPELRQMTSVFLARVLEEKPGDVLEFAATFFSERQYEVNE